MTLGCNEPNCCMCDLMPKHDLCEKKKCCMCAERQISQRFREVCPCAEVDTAQEAFLQRERTKEYKRAFDRGSLYNINGYPEPSEFVSRFQSTYMRDFQHPDIQALYHGYEKEAAGEINLDPCLMDDHLSRCCSCPPWGCSDRVCESDGCGTGGGAPCCSPCPSNGMGSGSCGSGGGGCGSACAPMCSPSMPLTCASPCGPSSIGGGGGGCCCGDSPCTCEYSIIFDQAKPEDDIPNSRPSLNVISLADPPNEFCRRMGPVHRPPRKSRQLQAEERDAYEQAERLRRSRQCCMPQCEPCGVRCGAQCGQEGYGYNTTCQIPRYTNMCAPNPCNVPAPLQLHCATGPPTKPCGPSSMGSCTPCSPTPGGIGSLMNRLTCMEQDLTHLNTHC